LNGKKSEEGGKGVSVFDGSQQYTLKEALQGGSLRSELPEEREGVARRKKGGEGVLSKPHNGILRRGQSAKESFSSRLQEKGTGLLPRPQKARKKKEMEIPEDRGKKGTCKGGKFNNKETRKWGGGGGERKRQKVWERLRSKVSTTTQNDWGGLEDMGGEGGKGPAGRRGKGK